MITVIVSDILSISGVPKNCPSQMAFAGGVTAWCMVACRFQRAKGMFFSAWFLARYGTDSRGNRAKKDIPNGYEARHLQRQVVGLVLCQRLHGFSFSAPNQMTTEMSWLITVP
jgi:hypothetical protein